MPDSESLSEEQVSQRITTGMALVYDLFSELNTFMMMIRETVESSDARCWTKSFNLPLWPRKSLSPADRYVSSDLGLLFELGIEDAAVDEGPTDDVEESETSTKGMQFTADSQFLAFHVILFHRHQGDTEGFVPVVVGALLSDIYRTSNKKGQKAGKIEEFTLTRQFFLRLVKKLDASTTDGQELSTVIRRGRLHATVSMARSATLASFVTEDSVQQFVQQFLPADSS